MPSVFANPRLVPAWTSAICWVSSGSFELGWPVRCASQCVYIYIHVAHKNLQIIMSLVIKSWLYIYIYICKWLANVYLLLACCLNVRDRSKVSFVKPQWNLRDLVILKFKKGGFESSMSMDFMVIYGDLMGFNGIWIRLMVNLWWF